MSNIITAMLVALVAASSAFAGFYWHEYQETRPRAIAYGCGVYDRDTLAFSWMSQEQKLKETAKKMPASAGILLEDEEQPIKKGK